jgi:2-oxoisovalerate dehydrogenase E1 component alpha subunit
MPSHWGNAARRVVTQSSVVTTQFLHATGIGLAAKMRKDPIVVLTSCGEGSTSKGDFHEALNFAAIHKLPIIFFVEKNTPSPHPTKRCPCPTSRPRAATASRVRWSMDGPHRRLSDVRPALPGRRGGGPFLIEARATALAPLHDDDDSCYRTKADLRSGSCGPLTLFRGRVEDGIFPREDSTKRALVDEEVRDAAHAMQPDPLPEDALTFVYKDPTTPP